MILKVKPERMILKIQAMENDFKKWYFFKMAWSHPWALTNVMAYVIRVTVKVIRMYIIKKLIKSRLISSY